MSREFARHVCDLLAPLGPVTARAMFGGYGLYCGGPMFGLIAWDTLYLKVDDQTRPEFEAASSVPFRPVADKAPMRAYWQVPDEVMADEGDLLVWARKAVAVAARTPPRRGREKA